MLTTIVLVMASPSGATNVIKLSSPLMVEQFFLTYNFFSPIKLIVRNYVL
jgi:hypothetical protein